MGGVHPIFLQWWHETLGPFAFVFWLFLFATWAAVQLRVKGVVMLLMMIAVQGVVGTAQNIGFFSHHSANINLINYWTFMLVISVVSVALATYLTENESFKISEAERKSRHFMETFVDFIPGMLGFWNRELRSTFSNAAYLKWFGKSAAEMHGIHMRELMGDALFQKNFPYIQGALSGEVQQFERQLTMADGEKKYVLAHYIPYLENNEVQGFFALILDIEERKRMEDALISVSEETQRLVGQELHDNLGQQIAAIAYQSQALQQQIGAGQNELTAATAQLIAQQAQQAITLCKQLAQGLLTFELETNGLSTALRALAQRTYHHNAIACDFECDQNIKIDNADIALNLYRITQEAVHNAIKHSDCSHFSIKLKHHKQGITLTLRDDGKGINEPETRKGQGLGIKIMRYRANQIGANFAIQRNQPQGTLITVEVPTNE